MILSSKPEDSFSGGGGGHKLFLSFLFYFLCVSTVLKFSLSTSVAWIKCRLSCRKSEVIHCDTFAFPWTGKAMHCTLHATTKDAFVREIAVASHPPGRNSSCGSPPPLSTSLRPSLYRLFPWDSRLKLAFISPHAHLSCFFSKPHRYP